MDKRSKSKRAHAHWQSIVLDAADEPCWVLTIECQYHVSLQRLQRVPSTLAPAKLILGVQREGGRIVQKMSGIQ